MVKTKVFPNANGNTYLILESKGDRHLLAVITDDFGSTKYIICTDLNWKARSWGRGSYYNDLIWAIEDFYAVKVNGILDQDQ